LARRNVPQPLSARKRILSKLAIITPINELGAGPHKTHLKEDHDNQKKRRMKLFAEKNQMCGETGERES